MAGRDELALIAELGVGFVGFVAVFLIFARREGRFSPADGYRIRVIIIAGVSVIFLALLPLTANLYGLTGTTLWRSASILGLVTHVAAILHVAPKQRALSPEDRAELVLRARDIPRAFCSPLPSRTDMRFGNWSIELRHDCLPEAPLTR